MVDEASRYVRGGEVGLVLLGLMYDCSNND